MKNGHKTFLWLLHLLNTYVWVVPVSLFLSLSTYPRLYLAGRIRPGPSTCRITEVREIGNALVNPTSTLKGLPPLTSLGAWKVNIQFNTIIKSFPFDKFFSEHHLISYKSRCPVMRTVSRNSCKNTVVDQEKDHHQKWQCRFSFFQGLCTEFLDSLLNIFFTVRKQSCGR